MHLVAQAACTNALLATLPAAEHAHLSVHLERVGLPLDRLIYDANTHLRYAYFPDDCIVSLRYVLRSGAADEIAVVGNEGLVGLASVMGGERMTGCAVVRRAGCAWRIRADLLRAAFHRLPALQRGLMRYSQALLTQIAQTGVCNRHHSIDQQLCRWLLMSLDRLPSNEIATTQERIAQMLGVRRAGVTEAAGKLQRAGVIHYSRGRVTVLDRGSLETRACECYQVISQECDRLVLRAPTHATHITPCPPRPAQALHA